MVQLGSKVIWKEDQQVYYVVAMAVDGSVLGLAREKHAPAYDFIAKNHEVFLLPKKQRPRYKDWKYA